MHPNKATELGLTVASEEPHKLPEGVVLTFAIDSNTGIQIEPYVSDEDPTKGQVVPGVVAQVIYWADGFRVALGDYNAIIATLQASERLGLHDELREKFEALIEHYMSPSPPPTSTLPQEDSDGPTEA